MAEKINDLLNNKMVLWILQTICAVSLTIGGYFFKDIYARINEVEAKQQVIAEWRAETSGNRFTSKDALEVWNAISDLKQEVALLPSSMPPKWFIDRVDKIEKNQESLSAKIDKLSENMAQK